MNKPIPFGKYFLLERINVGGMAEVFKAKAFGVEGFERLVAVKRILPNIAEDEEFITMFIDEAKIAVQLQHANIAQIFDLGKVDDSYFIALEYVHGKDLRGDLRSPAQGRATGCRTAQVCFVVMQVCEGLDYAHNKRDAQGRELNLVHRDVSPQNVLVAYEGEVKLIDFGIAKAAGKASKTQAGILKGKFGYMSPEQVRGLPVDRRSDIFALGIVLYELLTGERLFVGESDFSTLEKVRNVEILPPSTFNRQIPPELERIVLKALAKDVEDRYQNAIDLHDDLQAFLYSAGEFYSRKDLAGWMKQSLRRRAGGGERQATPQWEQLEQPTPAARVGGAAGRTPPAARQPRAGGLEWDDEELETQIFDREPGGRDARDEAPDEEELSSADILLQEPAAGRSDARRQDRHRPAARRGRAGPGRRGAGCRADLEPARYGSQAGGPPPGLSAYRQRPGADAPAGHQPLGLRAAAARASTRAAAGRGRRLAVPADHHGAAADQSAAVPGAAAPMPPPSYDRPSGRAAARSMAPVGGRRRRAPVATLLVLGLLVASVFGLYNFLYPPGQAGHRGGAAGRRGPGRQRGRCKGTRPITIEKAPGLYNLSFRKEGTRSTSRRWRSRRASRSASRVELEPSADTGFELTSDPPGAAGLAGRRSRSPAAIRHGPQARTDFKATGCRPGRHVLEIKGDPRFKAWRHEFFQEPGKHPGDPAPTLEPVGPRRQPRPQPSPARRPTPAEPTPPRRPPRRRRQRRRPRRHRATASRRPAPGAGRRPGSATAAPPRPRRRRPRRRQAATAAASPAARAAPRARPSSRGHAARTPAVGQPRRRPPRRRAGGGSCTVTIGSKPWSEVWIDGRNTGKLTPLVDHKVPCGRRKITLKNPDLQIEKNETITVRSGEKFKKIFQLLDEEG